MTASAAATPYAVWRQADGLVLRTGRVSNPDRIADLARDGEGAEPLTVAGVVADGRWRRQADGGYAQDAPTLAAVRAAALAALAAVAARRLALWQGDGAPSGGLQVDDTSTARLNAWATQALMVQGTGSAFDLPYWIMADNSHRSFTGAADFLAFAQGAAAYKTAAVLHHAALKAAIRAAGDAAAVAAVNINAGWPA